MTSTDPDQPNPDRTAVGQGPSKAGKKGTDDAPSPARTVKGVALGLAVLTLLQAVLGGLVLSGGDSIKAVHQGIGFALVIISIVAAVFARGYARETGRKGVFFHALSLPIMAIIQVGLGQAQLTWVHIPLGVLFLAAAFGLFAVVDRDPEPQE